MAKKTDKQKIQDYSKRIGTVNGPRSLKNAKAAHIIVMLNLRIAEARMIAVEEAAKL